MKKVLVYYPFQLAENANSGSKVRPHEMLKAFKQWGEKEQVEIICIHGNTVEREKQFKQLSQQGVLEDLWFCYMENQTIPLWLTDPGHKPARPLVDREILSFLKRKKVPVGIFYRDVYWKFDELYPLKGIKKFIMKSIYRFEEKFYEKYMDTIFLPSNEMGAYVDINRPMTELPPGGKNTGEYHNYDSKKPYQGLYVGGINNEDYGLYLLLDAIEKVNKSEQLCNLTVVCREDEYQSLPQDKRSRIEQLKVTVKHISGAKLDDLYKEMDFAFIPRYRNEYYDFSVPVKLVEYLSAGLPIVATDCTSQKHFIESGQYGAICKDEKESMAEAINNMIANKEQYAKNIKETFMAKHSWLARVEKVKNTLIKEVL
ncbi:glycosyltransferase [Bacillus luteolus]|uniref:Glycosyltransferase n=1 Tax=Litchfieldia luteola TaxID=682179 RepID=A0ABR9QF01_9BACI|nr:glycosyltransferase [Cytobacillus luteolus]MBE4907075.1 glycosyltransferase [Cytobacillus luteolus]MBP1943458.1 glycosyltransferase involved in cell wall biosynthesis [Cytobacillus luteolus]